jgi:poly-gamma-glutamate synthesis protein (capsule biosynthesis protein)
MSFANNHHLDWGYEAFFDTLDSLREAGIASVGSGKDEDEARKPVIIEKKGVRVAFLAYAPVTFMGYEADSNKAGSAPLTIHTYYRQVEHEQPGTAPDILTFADQGHLEAMREDIAKAKSLADIVVPTFHWGLHYAPVLLSMYEFEVGHAAIDAGADIILGHHQHILKGIEVYKGRVIFHGLSNFAFDAHMSEHAHSPELKKMVSRYGEEFSVSFREDYPSYPFHPDARQTIIAKIYISKEEITKVSFLPCLINKNGQPEPLEPGDGKFEKVKEYVEDITRQADLDTKFSAEDGEVTVLLK